MPARPTKFRPLVYPPAIHPLAVPYSAVRQLHQGASLDSFPLYCMRGTCAHAQNMRLEGQQTARNLLQAKDLRQQAQ